MIDEDRKRAEENLQQVKVAASGQRDDLMQQLQREQQGRSRAEADLTSLHRSAKKSRERIHFTPAGRGRAAAQS